MSDLLEENMQERIKAAKEILPLGDMNWLELRRINDRLINIAKLIASERKIVEYELLVSDCYDDFISSINRMLKIGWRLKDGTWSEIGPETSKWQGKNILYQVMVKYAE
jgi:hypothetical protein